MTTQMIALGQLELSPENVRKQRSEDRVRQFAASIEAQGVLEDFTVHPAANGKFGVVIGGTRLAALQLLLKQKKITAEYEISCKVRSAQDPALREISLAENVVRENLHPADEFEAFKKLADDGQRPETIAARFGVTPVLVKQRLKLAVVSPTLIALYRREAMTLDQLMAFTVSDDHRQQERVWQELPEWNRQRGDGAAIRAALTGQHTAADSKLARFVGIAAYEEAGGAVLRDLFDDRHSGWLTDFALLNRLVAAKLEAAAAPLRGEGWKWVEIRPERNRPDMAEHGRIQPAQAGPKPEQQAEIDTLQAEADEIMAEHGEEPGDAAAGQRLQEIYDRIDALSEGEAVWTDAQKGLAGIMVNIGHDGEVAIERGLVRPEDKAALRRLLRDNDPDQPPGAEGPKPPAKRPGGLSAALLAELTAQKTVAAQLVLAKNPPVALLAATHAIVLRQFYPAATSQDSSLAIAAHGPAFSPAVREVVERSPAARKLAGLVKGWQKKLPQQPEALWDWLARQKPATVQALLAIGTALAVDMVRVNGADAKPAADELARAMKLDMADHWEASAENYFTRVPKKQLLDELGDTLRPTTRRQVEGMKREMAAKTLVTELKGKRWLPDVLKAG